MLFNIVYQSSYLVNRMTYIFAIFAQGAVEMFINRQIEGGIKVALANQTKNIFRNKHSGPIVKCSCQLKNICELVINCKT